MAYTTCGNCEGHSFELSQVSPSGGNFIYYFIQCSACGVPVAAVEANYVDATLAKIGKRLSAIEDNQATIDGNIRQLATRLN